MQPTDHILLMNLIHTSLWKLQTTTFPPFFAVIPPSEPPVFEIPVAVSGMENEPIFIQIAATLPDTNVTEGLQVYVDNVPADANFSNGTREGHRWVFTPEEFGQVELKLPPDFSGMINLNITAVANGASRQRTLVIDIQPNITTTAEPITTPTTPSVEETTDVTGNISVTSSEMTQTTSLSTRRRTDATTAATPTTRSVEETTDVTGNISVTSSEMTQTTSLSTRRRTDATTAATPTTHSVEETTDVTGNISVTSSETTQTTSLSTADATGVTSGLGTTPGSLITSGTSDNTTEVEGI